MIFFRSNFAGKLNTRLFNSLPNFIWKYLKECLIQELPVKTPLNSITRSRWSVNSQIRAFFNFCWPMDILESKKIRTLKYLPKIEDCIASFKTLSAFGHLRTFSKWIEFSVNVQNLSWSFSWERSAFLKNIFRPWKSHFLHKKGHFSWQSNYFISRPFLSDSRALCGSGDI